MVHSFYQMLERWGADLWAEQIKHRYELTRRSWLSQMRRSDGEPNNTTGWYGLWAATARPSAQPRKRSRLASRKGEQAPRPPFTAPDPWEQYYSNNPPMQPMPLRVLKIRAFLKRRIGLSVFSIYRRRG